MLLKHWDHLRFSPYFVQTALYIATDKLRSAVAETIAACPNPGILLKHVTMHFGYKTIGHPGIQRIAQIESLLPYLGQLSEMDIGTLFEACNDHGWFEFRRAHLDARMRTGKLSKRFIDDAAAVAQLQEEYTRGWVHSMDHWVDGFMKTGVDLEHVMSVLGTWLMSKKDIKALQMVAAAIIYAGHRRHIILLTSQSIEPAEAASVIVTNASYWVRRRSLN